MEREKALGVPCGFELAHLPLPLTRRLMRDFSAIAGISVYTVTYLPNMLCMAAG